MEHRPLAEGRMDQRKAYSLTWTGKHRDYLQNTAGRLAGGGPTRGSAKSDQAALWRWPSSTIRDAASAGARPVSYTKTDVIVRSDLPI